jgi:hypothetical protein
MPKRDYPGRLTRTQWQALPFDKRTDLARRAQCDLLGSFRFCTNKACRRARWCASRNPDACLTRLWPLTTSKPKRLRDAYARFGILTNACTNNA